MPIKLTVWLQGWINEYVDATDIVEAARIYAASALNYLEA